MNRFNALLVSIYIYFFLMGISYNYNKKKLPPSVHRLSRKKGWMLRRQLKKLSEQASAARDNGNKSFNSRKSLPEVTPSVKGSQLRIQETFPDVTPKSKSTYLRKCPILSNLEKVVSERKNKFKRKPETDRHYGLQSQKANLPMCLNNFV